MELDAEIIRLIARLRKTKHAAVPLQKIVLAVKEVKNVAL